MPELKVLKSREDWLKERGNRIGGSEAACLLGLNPWKTNVELFREKMHPETVKEHDNPAMAYGRAAEPLIRELFKLNHPECPIQYKENNMFLNSQYPFAHASLDGWWTAREQVTGVLEIKTVTIRNRIQAQEWSDRIPNNYYCQVLWYLMVTQAQEAWLTALMQWHDGRQEIRDFHIERTAEVQDDIEMLMDAGRAFWDNLQNGREPALILPSVD
jgi:putative phage-type endonuclease